MDYEKYELYWRIKILIYNNTFFTNDKNKICSDLAGTGFYTDPL